MQQQFVVITAPMLVQYNDPFRGPVWYVLPPGTSIMEFSGWNAVPAPAVVEHPAPEGANASSGVEGDDVYVDAETGEPLPSEMQAGARDFDETIEALKWVEAEKEKEEKELQHVAELLSEEDKAEEAKKEEAKKLFVDANRKFQIQKGIFKTKGRCAELREAQVAYIKTRDELSAVMAEIKDPAFTLRAMADERWPDENHDDFEEKLRVIYNSIKSNLNYKPKTGKPAAVEKRAPAPLTLDQVVMSHVRGAKEAAGGGV